MENGHNYKLEHLESQILNILNQTLLTEIYDEIVKKSSFLAVKLSKDLTAARVYVDTYDRSQINLVVKKLQAASGVFRKDLAEKMSTRIVPKLFFVNDKSVDNSIKIEELIRKIH